MALPTATPAPCATGDRPASLAGTVAAARGRLVTLAGLALLCVAVGAPGWSVLAATALGLALPAGLALQARPVAGRRRRGAPVGRQRPDHRQPGPPDHRQPGPPDHRQPGPRGRPAAHRPS
jgi:hypothetical protein